MKNRWIGYYSFLVGLLIMGMWKGILLKGHIPEGKTEHAFHLTSEFITALLGLTSAILNLLKYRVAEEINIIGHGMVIYSVLNAARYYWQRRLISMAIMFLTLLVISTIIILAQIFKRNKVVMTIFLKYLVTQCKSKKKLML